MFDLMSRNGPPTHYVEPSREVRGEEVPAIGTGSNLVLDQFALLEQASRTAAAVKERLFDPNHPNRFREEVPLREAKDSLTAISTLLKSIRDSEHSVRREMADKLFKQAVGELLVEMDSELQTRFVARLREIEEALKNRTRREAA